MDNVTHTLVGALLGETAARMAPPAATVRETSARRALFLLVMIVGSNLPDSDLLYSLGSNDKLRYLLEHRGHTHTVLGALVGSALLLAACSLWQRVRGTRPQAHERTWLVALAVLGPLLHIGMDAFNSYGVHPWWPFDNRWFYGDSVFIVEPLFWAAAAPLAFLLRSCVARGLIVLVLLAGVFLAWATGIVAGWSIIVYCALVGLMLAMGWKASPGAALAVAIGLWVVITVAFAISSRLARASLDAYAIESMPRWKTLDHVLTPMPMNPLCWEVILVQSDEDRYALRRAVASIFPRFRCPTGAIERAITAPLAPVPFPDTPFVHWHGEIVASREQLRTLAATSCEADAFLRFTRAPWFTEHDRKLIGDLRYDREPELGFAELDLSRSTRCPAYVPPWIPPRQDLLER